METSGAVAASSRAWRIAALSLGLLGFVAILFAYWPGIMIDDARWQYQQAVDNSYEDWHPPLMAWVWRHLIVVHPGPAPMFVLQLALYWLGVAMTAYWADRMSRPRLALAIVLVGWIPAPLALTGSVTKDCLMAGALMSATGILLLKSLSKNRVADAAASVGALLLIAFATALRLNAVVACVPLLLAALPSPFTRTRIRLAATAVAGAAACLAIGPTINAMLHAEKTDVELSLIIFDLGGITEHSGTSQFPEFGVRDPVAVNHRCYDPVEWDSYSTWAKTPCPLGFEPFQNAKDDNDLDPKAIWARAILAHPIAYLIHRLMHFNLSTDFLVPSGPIFTAWTQSVANPWGYQIDQNGILSAISTVTDAAAGTPLGWPIFWICVGLAAFILGLASRAPRLTVALAGSSFLYGFSYLVLGVAVGMRYYFWTITSSALAALLLADHIARSRSELAKAPAVVAASVVIVPTGLAILARLLPLLT